MREVAERLSAPAPAPGRPAAHRNFQTCSLRLPQGGALTGLLTLCSSDCPLKKEKGRKKEEPKGFLPEFLGSNGCPLLEDLVLHSVWATSQED